MADDFSDFRAGLTSPCEHAAAVTPNDSTDLATSSRGVYVGGTGTLKVTLVSGDVVTFTGLAAGIIHPIRAKRIWSTGTSATSIIAVW